jgi:signal transduction histidine kinase/ActR/RegA family two-component response regulator
MITWRKKAQKESSWRGVARAALNGASRNELLQEALKALAQQAPTCRIGVWLGVDSNASPQNESTAGFHGMVWDRGNSETPQEWATLSVEPPLPEELLLRGKTIEQDLEAFPPNHIIGLLVGIRHALWVPIQRKEQLQGVIFAGSTGKQPACSRDHVESIAAELALALGLEEEQRIARLRNEDLGAVRRFLAQRAAAASVEALLSNLVESCTETPANRDGPGAAFAAIGALRDQREKSGGSFSVEFRWRSGDDLCSHAIDSEPLANVWRRALEARQVIGSESQMVGRQGSMARIVAFPLESEGQLLGTLVAGLPGSAVSLVTLDRLQLRAVLAASALRQRRRKEEESLLASWPHALLDCIGEPLFLLDEAGRITAASRGARDLTSLASKSIGPQPHGIPAQAHLAELFCGRDRERLGTWLRKALDHGAERRGTDNEFSRAELHNGVSVRLRLAVPVKGQATVILLEPLVTRKSPGRADLAEIELQSVIEWLEEGVILFDAEDNVRAMNTRFEQMAGLAPAESGKFKTLEGLIGRLQTHAAEPARFTERWRELARGIQGGVREEFQMTHPSPRVLERAARPVLDLLGRPLGRVEVYRDLTAQRVFHSKLLQTEKLAALGQMVSGVAHELSNPVTSIMGYAHRLLARQDLPGRTEEVRQIYQEAERAGTILRQLLLNARETLPERRPVSLNQIVHGVMDLQRFSLTAEKISVEIDLAPALPFVQGDPGHLQQVLMNLMGNARQALEQQEEGGTIRLRTKRIGDRRVLLEVADNGPGIPQAILARIFDPFFTTKPAGVGTGLGLAIVLSVVREHGGQVHVLSPPQGGAVFQIEFPVAAEAVQDEAVGFTLPPRKSSLPEAAEAASRGNRLAPAHETGKGARVLVVEDEPTVARLIADVLEDEGMHVDVLLDGREALARAAGQSFDLVICDMKMPGLDGQHFYKSLERSGNPLRKRFLFVTGDTMAAHTREFLERNHLPHVAKPFRVEELTEKVRSVLAIQTQSQTLTAKVTRKNAASNG